MTPVSEMMEFFGLSLSPVVLAAGLAGGVISWMIVERRKLNEAVRDRDFWKAKAEQAARRRDAGYDDDV